MSYYDNIYYSPEKFNLTTVGDVDIAGSYEFDTIVVFKDSDNKLYWTHDSGCSCPTPFEEVKFEDLTEITMENLKEFEKTMFAHRPYQWNDSIQNQLNWHSPSFDLYMEVFNLF
jgi:hypothetical protein